MSRLSMLLIHISQSKRVIVLALVAQLTFFRLLRITGKHFEQATQGYEPFDFQNKLTGDDINIQLPAYTDASKALYRRFFVIDFFFPLAASSFLALVWAAILRQPTFPVRQSLMRWHVPVLPYLPTLFDWGENISFLMLITRYPHTMPFVMSLGVAFKRLKLISLFATIISTQILMLTAGVVRLLHHVKLGTHHE